MTSNSYLMHHGIKGMHWGVRRYQNPDGTLTSQGKRRYSIQDARKYYKINRLQRAQEKTNDANKYYKLDKKIRRVQTRSDRKRADLSPEDINAGRQIVAKFRKNGRLSGMSITAAGTAAGMAILASNPKTKWAVPLAAVGGAAATARVGKKLPYYHMENRRYNQVNSKNAMTTGESKAQRRLKTARKVLGTTAAVAGGAALAYYAGKKIGANRSFTDQYTNASDAVKRIMDANYAYNRGQQVRKVANKVGNETSKQAKRVYNFATSEQTKQAVRNASQKAYNFATSEQTKQAMRNAGRKVSKTAKAAGRYTKSAYKGFRGI